MTSVDPHTFAREQSAAWSSVASAWHSWWHVLDGAAQHLNDRMVELAGIEPGQRVLDVACGIGEPALTAARRAAPGGRVVAVDLAPEMLEFARRRAAEAGVDVEFVEANAEELSVGEGVFDAGVSRWGLMLMLRPELAAKGIRRALRPGARFATSVWGLPERSPFLALARETLTSELGAPPIDLSLPGPFRFSDIADLRRLVEGAGFRDVTIETLRVAPTFTDTAEFARYMGEMSSALGKQLAEYEPEEVERYWAALHAAAEEYHTTEGTIRLESDVHCAVGTA